MSNEFDLVPEAPEQRVFDVQWVPRDWGAEPQVTIDDHVEMFDVVGVDSPSPLFVEACEVDGEAVLMCAMPWPRFCGPIGEQCRLPLDAAITLERFEEQLRAMGLMGANEVLRQCEEGGTRFRVEVTEGELASYYVGGVRHEALLMYPSGPLVDTNSPPVGTVILARVRGEGEPPVEPDPVPVEKPSRASVLKAPSSGRKSKRAKT